MVREYIRKYYGTILGNLRKPTERKPKISPVRYFFKEKKKESSNSSSNPSKRKADDFIGNVFPKIGQTRLEKSIPNLSKIPRGALNLDLNSNKLNLHLKGRTGYEFKSTMNSGIGENRRGHSPGVHLNVRYQFDQFWKQKYAPKPDKTIQNIVGQTGRDFKITSSQAMISVRSLSSQPLRVKNADQPSRSKNRTRPAKGELCINQSKHLCGAKTQQNCQDNQKPLNIKQIEFNCRCCQTYKPLPKGRKTRSLDWQTDLQSIEIKKIDHLDEYPNYPREHFKMLKLFQQLAQGSEMFPSEREQPRVFKNVINDRFTAEFLTNNKKNASTEAQIDFENDDQFADESNEMKDVLCSLEKQTEILPAMLVDLAIQHNQPLVFDLESRGTRHNIIYEQGFHFENRNSNTQRQKRDTQSATEKQEEPIQIRYTPFQADPGSYFSQFDWMANEKLTFMNPQTAKESIQTNLENRPEQLHLKLSVAEKQNPLKCSSSPSKSETKPNTFSMTQNIYVMTTDDSPITLLNQPAGDQKINSLAAEKGVEESHALKDGEIDEPTFEERLNSLIYRMLNAKAMIIQNAWRRFCEWKITRIAITDLFSKFLDLKKKHQSMIKTHAISDYKDNSQFQTTNYSLSNVEEELFAHLRSIETESSLIAEEFRCRLAYLNLLLHKLMVIGN